MGPFEEYYIYAQKMIVQKGDIIYDAKENGNAFFLHSGICALGSVGKNGEMKTHLYFMDQRIMGFAHFARQIYPHLDKLPSNPLIIIAKTDCIVYKIHAEKLQELIENDVHFNHLMFETLSQNYMNIFQRYLQMEEDSVPIRVVMFLMDYARLDHEQLMLPRFFTYSEIAEYLNIHQVTLSRVFSAMRHLDCVSKENHHIMILKPDVLEAIIDKKITLTY